MPRKETISSLKKLAWNDFSKYIRLRDCIKTTGTKDRGKCITCGTEYPFNKLQAGHFLAGRNATILFHEDMVNAQCYACNVMKHGNADEYWPIMLEKYGKEKIEEWQILKKQTKSWTKDELKEIRQNFKDEYNLINDLN